MMFLERKWHIVAPGLFVMVSLPLFCVIYDKSNMIIDEEFHIAQGLQYCNWNFTTVIIYNPALLIIITK